MPHSSRSTVQSKRKTVPQFQVNTAEVGMTVNFASLTQHGMGWQLTGRVSLTPTFSANSLDYFRKLPQAGGPP